MDKQEKAEQDIAIQVALLAKDQEFTKITLLRMEKSMSDNFAVLDTKITAVQNNQNSMSDYPLVRKLVFGGAALILFSVVGYLVSLAVKQK